MDSSISPESQKKTVTFEECKLGIKLHANKMDDDSSQEPQSDSASDKDTSDIVRRYSSNIQAKLFEEEKMDIVKEMDATVPNEDPNAKRGSHSGQICAALTMGAMVKFKLEQTKSSNFNIVQKMSKGHQGESGARSSCSSNHSYIASSAAFRDEARMTGETIKAKFVPGDTSANAEA